MGFCEYSMKYDNIVHGELENVRETSRGPLGGETKR